jgi:predicted molibdopterin-dependent oxidoreductase YjgC
VSFSISFDGEPVEALPGQTIAAALLAAGHRELRRTRFGERPRGIYCGIGACFDCLVVVNGVPSQRACLVEARPGDRVERQQGSRWDGR